MQHRQKKQKQQQMLPAERSGGKHPFSPPKPKLAALQRRAEEIKKDVATSMDQPPRPWITWNHPSICKRRPQSTYPVTASRLSMVRVNAKTQFLLVFHVFFSLLFPMQLRICWRLSDAKAAQSLPTRRRCTSALKATSSAGPTWKSCKGSAAYHRARCPVSPAGMTRGHPSPSSESGPWRRQSPPAERKRSTKTS